MVLNDLGRGVRDALKNFSAASDADDGAVQAMIKEVSAALLQSDVNIKVVVQLRKNISAACKDIPKRHDRKRFVQKVVVDELVKVLDPEKQPYKPVKGKTNIFMMVGLQGSGKTTTCAKLAVYYQRKGFRTALVCADTFRAGAFDQLKQSALAAKVPFYGSYTETDPVAIAAEGVRRFTEERFDLVIVDTSGRHKQEADLFKEMQDVHAVVAPDTTIFVMDSAIGQAAHEQATAFATSVDVGAVILTKLDGHAKGGGALSAVAATQSPVMFIGTGEKRDDLEVFKPRSFVSRLLGMGDIEGLFDKLENLGDMKEQEERARKLIQQKSFSFRDLKEQYQNIMKLGPLSSVMSMLPGGLGEMMGQGGDELATAKFRAYIVTMDSMNDKELDGLVPLNPSRIRRICRGSGYPPQIIDEMAMQLKQFSQMAGGLGRLEKASNTKQGITPDAVRNMLPPQMVNQLGGAQGLAKLMKDMEKMGMPGMPGGGGPGGAMPNMADLAKMFGGR